MCFLCFLQGLASCFGICAINHLEETLAKLEDFVRSDVFKKTVGLFSIFKVRAQGPPCCAAAGGKGLAQPPSDTACAGAALGKGVNFLPRCVWLGAGIPSASLESCSWPRSLLGISCSLSALRSRRLTSQRSRSLAGWARVSCDLASASGGGPWPDVERGLAVTHIAAGGRSPSGSCSHAHAPGDGGVPCPEPRPQKPFLKFSEPGSCFNSRSLRLAV